MTDPVAEAAAQIAAQQAPEQTGIVGALVEGMHKLEEKVEHLLHPGTPGNEPAVAAESATAPATGELPNGAATPPDGAATLASTEGEHPNAVSGADAPTAEPASASNADGASTTSPIAASSDKPLHVRIAAHLEAIYSMAKEHVESAPAAAIADTSALKTHVGTILHKLSNGISVSEGNLVADLEKLYRML